jgi:hypothetical protein
MNKLPITAIVQRSKTNKFPVNQEVTMKADGTGGPVSNRHGLLKQESEGCGCKHGVESPAKFDPLTMMVVSKVAKKLL